MRVCAVSGAPGVGGLRVSMLLACCFCFGSGPSRTAGVGGNGMGWRFFGKVCIGGGGKARRCFYIPIFYLFVASFFCGAGGSLRSVMHVCIWCFSRGLFFVS